MKFFPSQLHARRRHLCFVAALLAGTAITPLAMAQTLPSLLVGAGGGGGSGANGNGGSGGGGGGIGGGGGGSGYAYNGGAGGGLYNGVAVGGGGGISNSSGAYAPSTGGAGGSFTAYTNVTGGTGGDGSSGAGGGGIGGGGGGGGHGGGGYSGYAQTGDGGGGGGAGAGLLGSGGNGGVAVSYGSGRGAGGQGGTAGNLTGGDGANPPANIGGNPAGGGGGGGGGGVGGGEGGNAGYDTVTNSNGPFQSQNGSSGSSNAPVAVDYSQSYGIVGVGGGGGGGGGGGQIGDNAVENGGIGSNGVITINDGDYLSADMVMIGGDGGGGGGGSSGGSSGSTNNGGAGGNGSITVNGNSASLSVAHALLLGGEGGNAGGFGSGGGGGVAGGGRGGAGGNGTLSLENGGRLILGNLANVLIPAQSPTSAANGTGLFDISSTANIEVDAGNTATISAPINDFGGGALVGILTKDGAGRLILAGASDYTGGTTINGGVLQVGTNSAQIAYDTAKTGPLTVSIVPTDTAGSGQAPLQVFGTASVGGPLNVNLGAEQAGTSYNIGEKYGIVTATQGVSGSFSSTSVVGPYEPYLKVEAVYSADEADIELQPTPKTVESGHPYVASVYAQNYALFDVLSVPLQADAGYWLHGLGSFGHIPGATYNYKGFIIGRGVNVTPHLIVGGAISNIYSHTSGVDSSFVDGTSFGAEAYGIYTLPRWTLTSIAGVGHLRNRSTRYLPGIGAGKAANNGTYEGASFRANYALVDQQHLFISPYAMASYLHTHLGRGQETGMGGMNMGFGQFNTSQAHLGGGLTSGYKTTTHYGMLTAWAGLGGIGTLGNTHARVDETIGYHAYTSSMSAQVASVGLFTPSAGIQMVGKDVPWKLAVVWNGQFARRVGAQGFTLEGSYKF